MRYYIDDLKAIDNQWEFTLRDGTRFKTGDMGVGIYKFNRLLRSWRPFDEEAILAPTRLSALRQIHHRFGELQKVYSIEASQMTIRQVEHGVRGRKSRAWLMSQLGCC